MTSLPNGHYRTRAGSTVEVNGEHSGCVRVVFDWFEEPAACCDCVVEPYPEDWVTVRTGSPAGAVDET
jgi:hypothetical protein